MLLGRVAYGESDLVVTLLTEPLGRVSALARGARRSSKRFAGALEPMHTLRVSLDERPRADLAVLYTADPRDALVGNARRLCPGRTVSWPVDPPAGRHAAAHFAGAVADTVPEPRDLPPAGLRVSPDLSAWAGEWLAERLPEAAGPVAVHPGSGGRRKCWAPEHFAHLMGALGRPVVLLEGPADAAPCARTAALAGPGAAPARAAGLSVAQTAALLSRCRLYVGNDSGVSHLGAGLGVPTVAVFGPTDPRTWRPLGRRVVSCGGNGAWPDPALVLDACRRLLQPA